MAVASSLYIGTLVINVKEHACGKVVARRKCLSKIWNHLTQIWKEMVPCRKRFSLI